MSTEERFNNLIEIVKRIKKQYYKVLMYSNDQTQPNCYSSVKDAFDKFLALAEEMLKSICGELYSAQLSKTAVDSIYSAQLSTLYETIDFANKPSPFFSEGTYVLLDEMESFVKEEMNSFNTNLGL